MSTSTLEAITALDSPLYRSMDSGIMNLAVMTENLRSRPGMFGLDGTFPMYVAFLRGYAFSEEAEWLRGFKYWLAEKRGGGFNLGWEFLVIRATLPGKSCRMDSL